MASRNQWLTTSAAMPQASDVGRLAVARGATMLPGLPSAQPMIAMPVLAAAAAMKRKDIAPGFAGQGMGLIHKVRPAAEVMADLVKSAEGALARAKSFA